MTKNNFNVIIGAQDILNERKGKITISVEIDADNDKLNSKPQFECVYTQDEKNNKMEKLNVNLEHATNYLIQLFYQTGQRYSCTRTKIGKLLTIVAFKYARDGEMVFSENIYKYDKCGTLIKEIMNRFKDTDIYIRCSYNDDCKVVSQKIDEKLDVPKDYKDISGLDNNVKKIIKNVFVSFGSYSPAALGEVINPIVNFSNITNSENNRIDISKIQNLKLDDFGVEYSDCSLLTFLFK